MGDSSILKIAKTSWFFFVMAFLIVYILAIAVENNSAFAAGPWEGRIIDIETKEPLEGVVVLAVWQRAYRTPTGEDTYFYDAKEVLTDKAGKFEIPSYSPINLLPIISVIREPEFTIFKPGYLSLSSRHLDENVIDKPTEFKIYGKIYKLAPGVIELPKLKTREERLRNLPSGPTDVGAKKLPLFYKVVNEENKNLGLEEEWR
ncbi:MAG: hypothetical protein AB1306_01950 [Nitrospirota bacterium]